MGALGDGGGVVTNDRALAGKVRLLGNYGAKVKYLHEIKGENSRLDELQAAFLREKLKLLDKWNVRRKHIANVYFENLEGVREVILPNVPTWAEPTWHLFVIRHNRREELKKFLSDAGIGSMIHYPVSPHLQSAYANLGYSKGAFRIAEKLEQEILSLPMYPSMTDGNVKLVCETIALF